MQWYEGSNGQQAGDPTNAPSHHHRRSRRAASSPTPMPSPSPSRKAKDLHEQLEAHRRPSSGLAHDDAQPATG